MTPADEIKARDMPLFRGLDPDQVGRILAPSSIRRCPKGELIAREGEAAECLHLLLSGSVEVFTRDGTRDCTLLIFAPPDLFMPAAALMDEPYLASIRTLKLSRLMFLDARVVRKEMAQSPELACRFLAILAGQFRAVLRHIKDDRTRSGPQRLAAYLLDLIDKEGIGGSAELPFAKGTLASRLGMTPETMSRSLAALGEHGLVVRGHRVVLTDRDRVERFCNPDPLIDGRGGRPDVRAW